METSVTHAGLAGIQCITTLEDLSLEYCKKVTSVTRLATSKSLKKLDLSYTSMTDAGLAGIERITTLEDLSLWRCEQVTSVTSLATSKSGTQVVRALPNTNRSRHRSP